MQVVRGLKYNVIVQKLHNILDVFKIKYVKYLSSGNFYGDTN